MSKLSNDESVREKARELFGWAATLGGFEDTVTQLLIFIEEKHEQRANERSRGDAVRKNVARLYIEGWSAANIGLGISDNPYVMAAGGDYADAEEWHRGYEDAVKSMSERAQADPVLTQALRQYRHNNSDDTVFGYDIETINGALEAVDARIAELEAALKTLQADLDTALADKEAETIKGRAYREAVDQTARVLGRYFATLPPQDMAIDYPMDRLRIPSVQKMEAFNPNFTAEYLGEALHAIEAGILTGEAYRELGGIIRIQCTYKGKPYGIAISDEAVALLDERELSMNIATAFSTFIASELKRLRDL